MVDRTSETNESNQRYKRSKTRISKTCALSQIVNSQLIPYVTSQSTASDNTKLAARRMCPATLYKKTER